MANQKPNLFLIELGIVICLAILAWAICIAVAQTINHAEPETPGMHSVLEKDYFEL